jgi:SNF2 family DNA or RNA helicase
VLLAPLESAVTPLPHQLEVLKRAVKKNPLRLLLADEVGLGKTIEAGLVIRELKLRGLIKRVLVVAPTGLINQWISEMKIHFNEKFHFFIPAELANFTKYFEVTKEHLEFNDASNDDTFNPWTMGENVICPMDAIKPLNKRKGWTKEEVEKHNAERFLNVINAGWDLVIIDEAHRVAGADPSVARFKLGLGLGLSTPHILLLSATPHQGKSDAFHRLLTILDDEAFPEMESVNRKTIEPYLIRNEKRTVKDSEGKLLFKPRKTKTVTVSWDDRHKLQEQLYHDVTDYIRESYNLLERLTGAKKIAIGFLLVLIQRLITSSTKAVQKTLERRLEVLKNEESTLTNPGISQEEWEELDGDQQVEAVLNTNSLSNKNEIQHVELLLEKAKEVTLHETDVKTEKLLDLIYELQSTENDAQLKILIFTEFTATQQMLQEFLNNRGFSTTLINGCMSLDERSISMKEFAGDIRIMIATEAGGEGLNLQFCHVVVNYDLPWNPMRIEQRIGRVDRIGQKSEVLAVNMLIHDTVEARVREVIETKLSIICNELGIDKLGDILDSAEAGKVFEEIYSSAIQNSDLSTVDYSLDKLKSKLNEIREYENLYLPVTSVENKDAVDYKSHPFPFWVEQMTINSVIRNNGDVEKALDGWQIIWPDGVEDRSAVFSINDLEKYPDSKFLSVAHDKIKTLIEYDNLPHIPETIEIKCGNLPDSVSGTWSLWTLKVENELYQQFRVLPFFIHDNGKIFMTTAKAVWDSLITGDFSIVGVSEKLLPESLKKSAEESFQYIYKEMVDDFKSKKISEQEKKEQLFKSKYKAINKVGITNIKESRLNALQCEKNEWKEIMEKSSLIIPELRPMIVLKLKANGGDNG